MRSAGWLTLAVWWLAILMLPAPSLLLAVDPDLKNWSGVLRQARGQRVDWFAWGGSQEINTYIAWVAQRVEADYGVELNHVRITDTVAAVNKVLVEKQAGRLEQGSVDLIWINGENFRTLKSGNLLFGPLLPHLPNSRYLTTDSPLFQFDFGFPTEGYEAPWGHAQFVFVYDSARVAVPPRSFEALAAWIRSNPGRFSYPAPPDFVGTTFLKQVLYFTDGGAKVFQGAYTEQAYQEKVSRLWPWLRALQPHFWRRGGTYPDSQTKLDALFANGEVDFSMAFNPAKASNLVETGLFPETTRTFVMEGGSIANTHFTAIPFNARDKAGAAVVANFLLSPEAQLKKNDSRVWGDFTVLEQRLLSQEWRKRFAALPRGRATLAPAELGKKLPEPPSAWGVALEKAWRRQTFAASNP